MASFTVNQGGHLVTISSDSAGLDQATSNTFFLNNGGLATGYNGSGSAATITDEYKISFPGGGSIILTNLYDAAVYESDRNTYVVGIPSTPTNGYDIVLNMFPVYAWANLIDVLDGGNRELLLDNWDITDSGAGTYELAPVFVGIDLETGNIDISNPAPASDVTEARLDDLSFLNDDGTFNFANPIFNYTGGQSVDGVAAQAGAYTFTLTNHVFSSAVASEIVIVGPNNSQENTVSITHSNDKLIVDDFSVTDTSLKNITWSISGDYLAYFKIDSSTGELSFKSTPVTGRYIVDVIASNGDGKDTQTLTIDVTDNQSTITTDTSGNDTFNSTSASETFDGGAGNDKAIFSGNFSDYNFYFRTAGLEVNDFRHSFTSGFDGTDTLTNIERLKFADKEAVVTSDAVLAINSLTATNKSYTGNSYDYTIYNLGDGEYGVETAGSIDALTGSSTFTFADKTLNVTSDIKATFDQVTGLNNATGQMFRLYNAAFKRLPDASGLKYWIDKFSSGTDDSRAVAGSFIGSTEFAARYGSDVTDAKYVNTLYQNVLGRDADTSGSNYWVGQLTSGAETRAEVLLGFAESAENKTLFSETTGVLA